MLHRPVFREMTNQIVRTDSRARCDGLRHGIETLDIGLVNNMPDAAAEATERQFLKMITAGMGHLDVRLHWFMIPSTPRSEAARQSLEARYSSVENIDHFELDALIVTGSEPRAARLSDEPYWASMTKLIDWAQNNTVSTLWSCLAAHAVALYLDGLERRPLREKRTGVFACNIASDHIIARDAPSRIFVPHSRLNELRERELVASGYEMLTVSEEAGVDAFVRRDRSLFVLLQGHPEYEAASLLNEYRRDVGRYLRGESAAAPVVPRNFFESKTQTLLDSLTEQARTKQKPDLLREALSVDLECAPQKWEPWSTIVFRNWLAYIAREKAHLQGRCDTRAVT